MTQQVLVEMLASKISADYARPPQSSLANQQAKSLLEDYAVKPWTSGDNRTPSATLTVGAAGNGRELEGGDPVSAAHLVVYGVTPSAADLSYWKSELDRLGAFRDVLELMSKSRGLGLVEMDQLNVDRFTAVSASGVQGRNSPIAFILRSYSTFLGRTPTFGEIEDVLRQIFRDNTGPIDIEYSLRARSTDTNLKPASLYSKIVKSASWLGRRILWRSFNFKPFNRSEVLADFRVLDQLKINVQLQDDIRMLQVQMIKLIAG